MVGIVGPNGGGKSTLLKAVLGLVPKQPGGQQQRIFLTRALAQEAEIVLLDEPVSGVDAPSQHEVFDLLRGLQEAGKTVIVTTHDLSCVAERFDLALLLNRRVVAFGRPEEVFTPKLLNETYQSHLMILKLGDRTVAVEDRDHDV